MSERSSIGGVSYFKPATFVQGYVGQTRYIFVTVSGIDSTKKLMYRFEHLEDADSECIREAIRDRQGEFKIAHTGGCKPGGKCDFPEDIIDSLKTEYSEDLELQKSVKDDIFKISSLSQAIVYVPDDTGGDGEKTTRSRVSQITGKQFDTNWESHNPFIEAAGEDAVDSSLIFKDGKDQEGVGATSAEQDARRTISNVARMINPKSTARSAGQEPSLPAASASSSQGPRTSSSGLLAASSGLLADSSSAGLLAESSSSGLPADSSSSGLLAASSSSSQGLRTNSSGLPAASSSSSQGLRTRSSGLLADASDQGFQAARSRSSFFSSDGNVIRSRDGEERVEFSTEDEGRSNEERTTDEQRNEARTRTRRGENPLVAETRRALGNAASAAFWTIKWILGVLVSWLAEHAAEQPLIVAVVAVLAIAAGAITHVRWNASKTQPQGPNVDEMQEIIRGMQQAQAAETARVAASVEAASENIAPTQSQPQATPHIDPVQFRLLQQQIQQLQASQSDAHVELAYIAIAAVVIIAILIAVLTKRPQQSATPTATAAQTTAAAQPTPITVAQPAPIVTAAAVPTVVHTPAVTGISSHVGDAGSAFINSSRARDEFRKIVNDIKASCKPVDCGGQSAFLRTQNDFQSACRRLQVRPAHQLAVWRRLIGGSGAEAASLFLEHQASPETTEGDADSRAEAILASAVSAVEAALGVSASNILAALDGMLPELTGVAKSSTVSSYATRVEKHAKARKLRISEDDPQQQRSVLCKAVARISDVNMRNWVTERVGVPTAATAERTSLQRLADVARSYAEILSIREASGDAGKPQGGTTGHSALALAQKFKQCLRCGRKGHVRTSCHKSHEDFKCERCGGVGHHKSVCLKHNHELARQVQEKAIITSEPGAKRTPKGRGRNRKDTRNPDDQAKGAGAATPAAGASGQGQTQQQPWQNQQQQWQPQQSRQQWPAQQTRMRKEWRQVYVADDSQECYPVTGEQTPFQQQQQPFPQQPSQPQLLYVAENEKPPGLGGGDDSYRGGYNGHVEL